MNAAAPIYLDYAATTPVDPAVAAVMSECLTLAGTFGNPASAHAFGRAAAQRVAAARAQVAALIGALPQEIVFTSGATESNNLAILGVRGRQRRPWPARHHHAHRAQGGARSLPPSRAPRRTGHLPRARAERAAAPAGARRGAAPRHGAGLDHARQQRDRGAAGHRRPRRAVSRARRHLPLRCGAGGAAHGARRARARGRPALVHGAQALWTQGHRRAVRAHRRARRACSR